MFIQKPIVVNNSDELKNAAESEYPVIMISEEFASSIEEKLRREDDKVFKFGWRLGKYGPAAVIAGALAIFSLPAGAVFGTGCALACLKEHLKGENHDGLGKYHSFIFCKEGKTIVLFVRRTLSIDGMLVENYEDVRFVTQKKCPLCGRKMKAIATEKASYYHVCENGMTCVGNIF